MSAPILIKTIPFIGIRAVSFGLPVVRLVAPPHIYPSAFDDFTSGECNLPFIRKIEDEPVILDCVVPPPPQPPATCDTQLYIPPPVGLDGVCPHFSVIAITEVGDSGTFPSVEVELCVTPAETSPGVLDLANCDYQMCFKFDIPEANCPVVDITGLIRRVANIDDGGEASLVVERVSNSDSCAYDFNFDFYIPCTGINLNVTGTEFSISGSGPSVGIAKNTEGCDYTFDFEFKIPCVELVASAVVSSGAAAVSLDVIHTTTATVCAYDFNFDFEFPCAEITAVAVCPGPNDVEISIVKITSSTSCDYEFNFDFNIPCLDITGTASVSGGPSVCALVITPAPTPTVCAYDFNFDFKIPCLALTITGEVTGDSRATLLVTRQTNVDPTGYPPDPGDPCEYGFDFEFNIPCAVIDLTAVAEFTDATSGLSVVVEKLDSGDCIYDFNFEFKIPCAEITAEATVVGTGACHLDLVHVQTVNQCAYDFNFDFEIPCADIIMTAGVSSGAGSVVIDRTFSSLTSLSASGIPMTTCVYDFNFDFQIGCPTIDIAAKVVTTNTFQFSKNPKVSVNRSARRPSPPTTFVDNPNARGNYPSYKIDSDTVASGECEYDFDLEFKIPKFCPKISTSETVLKPLSQNQIATNGTVPLFLLDGVFDPKECSYSLQPFLFYHRELAKCTPVILTAKLQGTMSCQTGCVTAEVFGSAAATGVAFGSVTVCPNSRDAYFRNDLLQIIYDCSTNTWSPLSSGTGEVFGIAQAQYDGNPGNVIGVFEVVGVSGTYISATLSADIFIKAGDKVKLSLEATCQWVVPDGRRSLHGTFTRLSSSNGTLQGVFMSTSNTPYGVPEDGCPATAVMVAGIGWIVIATDCECT